MARTISDLKSRELVRVKFHGSKRLGNEPYELDLIFEGMVLENGKPTRAHFTFDENPEPIVIEVYKMDNRWRYGTSAEVLTLVNKSN